MKVFWWQGGLHLEPETSSETSALQTLWSGLSRVEVDHGVLGGPVTAIPVHDQQPVGRVHIPPEMVTDGRGGTGQIASKL